MAIEEVSISNAQYTAEFKAEAIKQVIDRGHAVVEDAARLGLPKHTLYDWVRKAAAQPAGQAPAVMVTLAACRR